MSVLCVTCLQLRGAGLSAGQAGALWGGVEPAGEPEPAPAPHRVRSWLGRAVETRSPTCSRRGHRAPVTSRKPGVGGCRSPVGEYQPPVEILGGDLVMSETGAGEEV